MRVNCTRLLVIEPKRNNQEIVGEEMERISDGSDVARKGEETSMRDDFGLLLKQRVACLVETSIWRGKS